MKANRATVQKIRAIIGPLWLSLLPWVPSKRQNVRWLNWLVRCMNKLATVETQRRGRMGRSLAPRGSLVSLQVEVGRDGIAVQLFLTRAVSKNDVRTAEQALCHIVVLQPGRVEPFLEGLCLSATSEAIAKPDPSQRRHSG
jgi:hypothetical protein